MQNQLINFDGQSVRMAGTKDEPLFALKDVCTIFDIKDHKQVGKTLEPYEKQLLNKFETGSINNPPSKMVNS